MDKDNKMRVALIQSILEKYSDENHPLTTNQIIDYLKNDYNMPVHRTTIPKDIKVLQEMGVDVQFVRSTQNRYFIGSRYFELVELKLLIDAIASSKFISEKKSEALVEKMERFASVYQRSEMKRNVRAEERVKPVNEYTYYIADTINKAINENKKLSFYYYDYNSKKEKQLRNNGNPYIFSPYTLVWNGDYYYVVGFSDKHGKIGSFRVDRINSVPQILEETAVPMPDSFNIAEFTKTVFQMYDSRHETVTLKCDNEMMKVIIDRFGEDVHTEVIDENSFKAVVEVSLSPNFYGWLFGFGGKIKIISPEKVKQEYRQMLEKAMGEM